MPGLAVDGIHTYYEDSHVLHGVSIDVAPGEAVALLGRNGAGRPRSSGASSASRLRARAA